MFDKESGSFASVWVTVVIIFFSLMLIYMSFYKLIVITLYDMVLYYGGDLEAANNTVTFFKIFPIPFMFTVIVWALANSFRRETDKFQRQF
jgi:hypothetical protein